MKRGYLLPKGCKDLIDALKSKQPKLATAGPAIPEPLPPATGEMTVPASMTVRELADALTRKPFQIIADLMEIGVFAGVNQQLDFDTVSRVIRKYGFKAKRAA